MRAYQDFVTFIFTQKRTLVHVITTPLTETHKQLVKLGASPLSQKQLMTERIKQASKRELHVRTSFSNKCVR